MLQFDLMVGCEGRATTAAGDAGLTRCTLMTTYPGERHGYRLEAGREDAHVYHLKLAVRSHRGLVDARPFLRLLTDQPEPAALRRAFDELVRLHEARQALEPLALAAVARVIVLWPTAASLTAPGGRLLSEAILTGTRAQERLPILEVLDLIDRRLDDPPPLAELAGLSHVSARHFARRFRQVMGCTPLSYINARRVAAARRLLAEHDRSVREVGRAMGFASPPAFTRWFRQQAGTTPQRYRDDPTRM
jgi:AraC-like DNA-binding protein